MPISIHEATSCRKSWKSDQFASFLAVRVGLLFNFGKNFFVSVVKKNLQKIKKIIMTPEWFEHPAFWSGVKRATVAPWSLLFKKWNSTTLFIIYHQTMGCIKSVYHWEHLELFCNKGLKWKSFLKTNNKLSDSYRICQQNFFYKANKTANTIKHSQTVIRSSSQRLAGPGFLTVYFSDSVLDGLAFVIGGFSVADKQFSLTKFLQVKGRRFLDQEQS